MLERRKHEKDWLINWGGISAGYLVFFGFLGNLISVCQGTWELVFCGGYIILESFLLACCVLLVVEEKIRLEHLVIAIFGTMVFLLKVTGIADLDNPTVITTISVVGLFLYFPHSEAWLFFENRALFLITPQVLGIIGVSLGIWLTRVFG